MYILVIDDDSFANALTQYTLSKEGYEVETMDNPRGAMQLMLRREPDLLLVDITMPYLSGFEFIKELVEEGFATPYIFLTAQNNIEAKLQGFHMGAEDYICKPFNHHEMVARVEAIMRRIKQGREMATQSPNLCAGNVELLVGKCKVIIRGIHIALTRTETSVLQNLMVHTDQVIGRDYLLNKVWNDTEGNSNIVDVYIRRLRAKIETNPNKPEHIISVRGIGYKFIGG
jgi:DNA-binding response OmpR family regulator